jgi:2-polyprenyl-3-methyl-5-hydroxy-6-metoxy-1,4-benzoquinol methylase
MMNADRVGKSHWDHEWESSPLLNAFDPHVSGIANYVNRKYHDYFNRTFSGMVTYGKQLLEVGCARSQWLPYFAKEFGFKVAGIDYSEIGCTMAKEILSNAGVTGEVINADFFKPPENMLQAYDVVVSFGVIEHFEDTTAAVIAISRFLKPDGFMISLIPNMNGMVGFVQKIINRSLYRMHVPLDREQFAEAHRLAALEVQNWEYFIYFHFGVCSVTGIPPKSLEWILKKSFVAFLVRLQRLVWALGDYVIPLKPGRMTSAYIICVAQKRI